MLNKTTISLLPEKSISTENGLDFYQALADLSEKMVLAAKSRNWLLLTALEIDVELLAQKHGVQKNFSSDDLEETALKEKSALIKSIIQNDAFIRYHTEPWQTKLNQFFPK